MNSPVEVSRWTRALELRDPEVGHLRLARGQHDHVRGLDVAVNDTLRVRVAQGAGHLRRRSATRGPLERPPRASSASVWPRSSSRAMKSAPRRRVAPHVVHDDDPRVLQLGRDLGLAQEALLVGAQLVVAAAAGAADDLERHRAVEHGIARLVHDAHRAASELAQDLVASDRGRRRQVLPRRRFWHTARRRAPAALPGRAAQLARRAVSGACRSPGAPPHRPLRLGPRAELERRQQVLVRGGGLVEVLISSMPRGRRRPRRARGPAARRAPRAAAA